MRAIRKDSEREREEEERKREVGRTLTESQAFGSQCLKCVDK